MSQPRGTQDVEAPVPDLLDHRGRVRRLAVAAAIATLCAVVVALGAYALVEADVAEGTGAYRRTQGAAWRFVIFFTALGWVLSLLVARWALERQHRRRDSLVPRARLRR
jgi:uncharacterized membrane protein YbhN (UPF0104 family)